MSGLKSARDPNLTLDERLKILYPMVNEDETPLPRCWSFKDKFNYIGLSQVNMPYFKGPKRLKTNFSVLPFFSELFTCIIQRLRQNSQRCLISACNTLHSSFLWPLLLRGQNHLQRPGWVHGYRSIYATSQY